MKKQKALLLHLPVQSHDYLNSMESFPLATGYLAAYAQKECKGWDVEILSQEISQFAGDSILIEQIVRAEPDLVGFGCYLWNVERTLYIAKRLKERLPELVIVFGGPEITLDNQYLLETGGFDVGIIGEGEVTFTHLLGTLAQGDRSLEEVPGLIYKKDGKWLFTGLRKPLSELDAIPSPYLQGLIGPTFLNSIALETVRGCLFRCLYCYYQKSFNTVRPFSLYRLREELVWALNQGVEEISILDPSFNCHPHFRPFLNMLQKLNPSRKFRIFCEVVAHILTPSTIQEMAKAGISHVEVGIQSTNQKALSAIGRPFPVEKILPNLKALREEGIHVSVDLIIGLPEDDFDGVKQTVEFLADSDAYDEIMVYPLSVLPGTELRARAEKLGLRYQPRPPYYVMETPTMSYEGLHAAFRYCEDAFDVDLFPPDLPVLGQGEGTRLRKTFIVNHVVIEGGVNSQEWPELDSCIGESITILVKDTDWKKYLKDLIRKLSAVFRANPFSLVDWVFPLESFPSEETCEVLRALCHPEGHPLNREIFAPDTPHRQVQFFALQRSKEGLPIDITEVLVLPVYEVVQEDLERAPDPLLDAGPLWLCFAPSVDRTEIPRFLRGIKDRLSEKEKEPIYCWDFDLEEVWNPLCPPIRSKVLKVGK